MEPRGRERHRWAKPRGRNGRERMSQRGQQPRYNGANGTSDPAAAGLRREQRVNGADGISDVEGKVARVAMSELGDERISMEPTGTRAGLGPI